MFRQTADLIRTINDYRRNTGVGRFVNSGAKATGLAAIAYLVSDEVAEYSSQAIDNVGLETLADTVRYVGDTLKAPLAIGAASFGLPRGGIRDGAQVLAIAALGYNLGSDVGSVIDESNADVARSIKKNLYEWQANKGLERTTVETAAGIITSTVAGLLGAIGQSARYYFR